MKDILTKAIAFDELRSRLKDKSRLKSDANRALLELVDVFLNDALSKAKKRTQCLGFDDLSAEQIIQLAGPNQSYNL